MPKRKNKNIFEFLSLNEESINDELFNILNSVKGKIQNAFSQPKAVDKNTPYGYKKSDNIQKNDTDEERFKKAKDITNKLK